MHLSKGQSQNMPVSGHTQVSELSSSSVPLLQGFSGSPGVTPHQEARPHPPSILQALSYQQRAQGLGGGSGPGGAPPDRAFGSGLPGLDPNLTAGVADFCRCYACGGGFHNWQPGRCSSTGKPVVEESNYPVQEKCDNNCENDGNIIGKHFPCLHLFCRRCRADPLLTSRCKVCNDEVKDYHALDLTPPMLLNGIESVKKCPFCRENDFRVCNWPCGHCLCGRCANNNFVCKICEKTVRFQYMVDANSFHGNGEQFGDKFNLERNSDMFDRQTGRMKCSQCQKFAVRIVYRNCGHCVCTGCSVDKNGRFCGICKSPVVQLWPKEICLNPMSYN
ncbi:hypothetical protein MAR_019108 [Mya arenaria]|uniref:RING-type domain-containing protein n=1 Tax=Mya arenaria TaxID=6604 RepID=A0ABY7EH11_MYAAR|nr:hypothetical protein MAR_019108 [Mya arenaria]